MLTETPAGQIVAVTEGDVVGAIKPRNETYQVKPGDTLTRIALSEYGDANLQSEIIRANAIANPRMLMPGTRLRLPVVQVPSLVIMNYVVPGMKLIPQTMSMSCWYASARMLIWWRRHRVRQTEPDIMDPREDRVSQHLRSKDEGIGDDQLVAFAQRLGLTLVPPQSPSTVAILEWLRSYGPLWVVGVSHIVVIAGIRSGPPTGRTEVLVYDPAALAGCG
jgi:papain like cysteine protease AvrRpt2/LysM domain-containing protein